MEGRLIGLLRHDHARCQSGNTAIASFDRGAEQGAWIQSEDDCEVAEAAVGRASKDGTDKAALIAWQSHLATILPGRAQSDEGLCDHPGWDT